MPIIASSCSAACLAALFHLSENRVRALARLKIIKRLRRGQYDLLVSVEGYILYLRRQHHGQKYSPHSEKTHTDGLAVLIRRMAQSIRHAKSKEFPC